MDNNQIKIELQGVETLKQQLTALINRGGNLLPLMRKISEIMYAEVEENFAQHGRDPKWKALKPSTIKSYAKKGYLLEPTLNRTAAGLLSSIQSFASANSAGVSTNKPYAAIHNFGGTINREPRYNTTRLRTDAKGNLLRQGAEGLKANLALFARGNHKRATHRMQIIKRYTIDMPQREFMIISPDGMGKIEQAAVFFIIGA